MTLITLDRIKELSTTTGTGAFTLAGLITGFRDFGDVGDTNTCYYSAFAVDGSGVPTGEFEEGLGTFTASGTTFSRDTVFRNSLGTQALINFSAGDKHILLSPLAKSAKTVGCTVKLEAAGFLMPNNATTIVDFDGTNTLIDTDDFHEGVTNPERLTVPPGLGGTYIVIPELSYPANANGYRTLDAQHLNSASAVITSISMYQPAVTNGDLTRISVVLIAFNAIPGDFFRCRSFQQSGSGLTLTGSAGSTSDATQFTCKRISL